MPTDFPELDGTLEWDRTTLVLVVAAGGGKQGIGYTYADSATATLIRQTLSPILKGMDAMSPAAAYMAMWRRIRNLGRPGICSMAISAVDCALWDLKARLLNLPLVTLLGQVRDAAPIYGSGGFISYSDRQLSDQLSGWVKQGIRQVKMKIGRDAIRDVERVRVARKAISPETELYVDANGAYNRKQALTQAERFAPFGVTWFEEPVSSDDLEGLRIYCVTARRQAWRLLRANTAMTFSISATCFPQERLTCSRPMLPVAAASPDFCRWPPFARRITYRFQPTPLPRCILTLHVQ